MVALRGGHFSRHPLIHCFADCRAISTQVFGCLSHKKKHFWKLLYIPGTAENESLNAARLMPTLLPLLSAEVCRAQFCTSSTNRSTGETVIRPGNDIFCFVACWCRSCEIEQSQSSRLLLSLLRQVHNMPLATFRVEILLLVSCSCDVCIRVSVSFSIWFDNVFLSRWTTVSNVKLALIAIAMAVSMSSSEGSH